MLHRAACFQTTPVAAARAGRSSRDRAPAIDVPALLDRFQQDFGSIVPEKGKKGFKFDPNNAVRLMDSWMQIMGVTPAGRMEHEPASSTVVVSNRPVWGDVFNPPLYTTVLGAWREQWAGRTCEARLRSGHPSAGAGREAAGALIPRPAPLANEHVAGNRESGEEARCARGSSRTSNRANSKTSSRAGSASGSADHDSRQPAKAKRLQPMCGDCGVVRAFSGGGRSSPLPDERLDCRGDCGGRMAC